MYVCISSCNKKLVCAIVSFKNVWLPIVLFCLCASDECVHCTSGVCCVMHAYTSAHGCCAHTKMKRVS